MTERRDRPGEEGDLHANKMRGVWGPRGEGQKRGEGEAEPGLSRQPGERWLWPECLAGMGGGGGQEDGPSDRRTAERRMRERRKEGGRKGPILGRRGKREGEWKREVGGEPTMQMEGRMPLSIRGQRRLPPLL